MARPRQDQIASTADGFSRLLNDWDMAKDSRMRRKRTGIIQTGSSADYHVRAELPFYKMMEYARHMDRHDAFVGQLVDRAVTNVVQDGFKVDPVTGDKGLNGMLSKRWREWSTNPPKVDAACEKTFREIERLICRHVLIDGDVFAIPYDNGRIDIIEAHRVLTPTRTTKNIVCGILIDRYHKHLECSVAKESTDPKSTNIRVKDLTAYPIWDGDMRQVCHVYHPKRTSQTRGMTALAPAMDLATYFEDLNFAKLLQSQIVSCITFLRQREHGSEVDGEREAIGEVTTQTLDDGVTRTIEGIAPGMELSSLPGERIEGFSPNVPNPEYFEMARLTLQLISVNLGMPLQMALLDPTQTNFSGWRGAVDQARLGFKQLQQMLVDKFHGPIWRFKVLQWMDDDPALREIYRRKGEKVFLHRWHLPTWPYIEPHKDAQTDKLRIDANLTSPRRVQAERGRDYEEVMFEIIEDRASLIQRSIKRADRINKANPDAQVSWRDLAGMDARKDAGSANMPQREAKNA